MADEIKGVALLHTVLWDKVPRDMLMICCVGDPANGRGVHLGMIPVRLDSQPESVNPGSWQYRVDGDVLHVCPSVRMTTRRPLPGRMDEFPKVYQDLEQFHNGYQWSVRFIDYRALPAEAKEEGTYEMFWRLNAEYRALRADI